MERREEGPAAPVTMNAFELISKSQGLNLSSLFEKQMVTFMPVKLFGSTPNHKSLLRIFVHCMLDRSFYSLRHKIAPFTLFSFHLRTYPFSVDANDYDLFLSFESENVR